MLNLRQPDLTVLMDNVHKPHNLSAVLRTCDATGVLEAHAVWPQARIRASRGVAGGSAKWVPVKTFPDVVSAIDTLRGRGYQVLAAHLSDRARDFRDVDFTRPSCVLLGAELFGPSEAALEKADEHIIIPMQGMVESLNVSVAAATILFEAQRQRLAAGLYDHPRIDRETYERLLFEWAQPKIAAYCREHNMDYPALDADGDVVDFRP